MNKLFFLALISFMVFSCGKTEFASEIELAPNTESATERRRVLTGDNEAQGPQIIADLNIDPVCCDVTLGNSLRRVNFEVDPLTHNFFNTNGPGLKYAFFRQSPINGQFSLIFTGTSSDQVPEFCVIPGDYRVVIYNANCNLLGMNSNNCNVLSLNWASPGGCVSSELACFTLSQNCIG